jgi:CheY-like chemotaxis protein
MEGWEVSRHMNQISPDFPIIVATGWNVSLEDARDKGVRIKAVLRKPFGLKELAQAIELALG